MSHSQAVAAKTIAAVERAREEVNSCKSYVSQLVRSENAPDQEVSKNLAQHVTRAESVVMKAEATVKRMRQAGRVVPPRPTASSPPAYRAERALSVLLIGLNSNKVPADGAIDARKEKSASPNEAQRNVRQKTSNSSWTKPLFLSAAGKPAARPIREDEFGATLQRVARETELTVRRLGARSIGSEGIGFECRNVFRAFIWFKEADPPGEKPPASQTAKHSYIVPEHIGCFGVDESNASRWSCSRHAVFNVVTERANAAVRYFMARENTGEEAFVALAKWIARHKTLFSSKFEDRRLAFDASRGIFLPCCIYPFEGDGEPRFTRGSIPVRNNFASYPSLPTLRMPSGASAQNAQTQNPLPNVANGAQAPSGSSAAPTQGNANAAPPARREAPTVVKQQPIPVSMGSSSRGNTGAAQNRRT